MAEELQLSICVPSYNVSAYLPQTLASYADVRLEGRVEVIVVDDGSTDDGATLALARSFERSWPGIFRVLTKPNGGHGSAINAALAVARGRYFRTIDADDWVDSDALLELTRRLEGLSCDCVVDVKTEVDMATRAERRFDLPAEAPLDRVLPFEEVCVQPELTPFLMIHTLSFRTEQLRACGLRLLEKTFYEDFEYVVKGTLDAADLCFVDLTVYRYLVGNAVQSVADASYVRRWADHERVTQEICALYERRRASLSPARAAYLFQRACLIVNTHYNIALIFDADRARGLARARSFRWRLERDHGSVARATQRRYLVARACHAAGVSSQAQLNALLRR